MDDEFGLSRFEREVIRYLRALPFEVQQHVSRTILRLCKEHGTVPLDPNDRPGFGEVGTPVWNLTHDELAKLREEMGMEEE
jgi:hypothetical protein